MDLYRYRAERGGMEVHLDIARGPLDALIDAGALELSIMNLLDNATKYAREGGRVDVTVARATTGMIEVRVSDRGPGIDPEEQGQIFERFVRGRRVAEHRARGSGIGLALVKHIAESHSGSISVRSPVTEDGRGSTFVFSLPALPKPRLTAPVSLHLAE